MKTKTNPPDNYKKLNSHSVKKPNNRSTVPRQTKEKRPAHPEVIKPVKRPSGQIAVVVMLSLLCLGLIVLIVVLLQPQKTQFWQSIPGKIGDKTAIVKRLETPVQTIPEEIQKEEVPEPAAGAAENPKTQDSSQTRETRVYFVKVNAEGLISLKSVSRNIDFSKSPLTQTINSLIGGPVSDEINKGSLTLIPEGTRLLSARVEGGTAYLNFNEAFRFNPLGREGYMAQLKQIVYTSTEFPSIKNVQILIEGVIREYLGGEGFYIGEPLSRDSFQNTP